MKKFKKSLVISVPQEDHHQTKSPTHIHFKQNQQRPPLTYNQHTIASSANNEDQSAEYGDRQIITCQEFVEFHGKNTLESKNFENNSPTDPTNKNHRYKKINVIQFQEFNLQTQNNKSILQTTICKSYNSVVEAAQKKQSKNHRREFSIEIPQNQEKQIKKQIPTQFAFDIKNQSAKNAKENLIKQPPAPSNKTKLSKTLNRHFVFPTNDEEIYLDSNLKKQKQSQKLSNKLISDEDHQKKIKELNQEWSYKLEALQRSFEKERQQFYKEKSSLQKDLMIKDGQIEMLQKLITNRYSPKSSKSGISQYSNQQFVHFQKQDFYKSEKHRAISYANDDKISSMETILLQKDLKINSLLQKINEINILIDKKNNELEEVKINLLKSQKINESLRNQLFIHEKKEQSEKLTKQFYKIKQTLIQVQQPSKSPHGFSRSKWQQQIELEKQKEKSPEKNEYPMRGIDDLHKRLQSLKMNRIQLENRGRIKSELGYPLTSKNKTKGTFDFKGKIYDKDRDYINQTRMY